MQNRSLIANEASVSYTPSMSEVHILENPAPLDSSGNPSTSSAPATVHNFTPMSDSSFVHSWISGEPTKTQVIHSILGDRNIFMKVVYTVCSFCLLLKMMSTRPEYIQTEYTIHFCLFYFISTLFILASSAIQSDALLYYSFLPEEGSQRATRKRAERKWKRLINFGVFVANLGGVIFTAIDILRHKASSFEKVPTSVFLKLLEPFGRLHFEITMFLCLLASLENVFRFRKFSVRARAVFEILITGNLIVFCVLFWIVYRKTSIDLKSTHAVLKETAIVSFEIEEATKTFIYGIASILVLHLISVADITSRLRKTDLTRERSLEEASRSANGNIFIWVFALIGLGATAFLIYQWVRNEAIFSNALNTNKIFKKFENLIALKKSLNQGSDYRFIKPNA